MIEIAHPFKSFNDANLRKLTMNNTKYTLKNIVYLLTDF